MEEKEVHKGKWKKRNTEDIWGVRQERRQEVARFNMNSSGHYDIIISG